ncbi:MAG: hypothetical protein ACD_17C00528G0001, partial [uncultured bacterium]
GLAVSDASRRLALPVGMVPGGKKAIQNIQSALPLKEIGLIVIGLPLEMSGKKGAMASMVEEFAHLLEEALHIPVQLLDERLSTKLAHVKLKELHLNRKAREKKLDMIAATLLLQTYLDQRSSQST